MSATPTVLVHLPQEPWPPRSGYHLRCGEVVDSLLAMDVRPLLTVGRSNSDPGDVPEDLEVLRYRPGRIDQRVKRWSRRFHERTEREPPLRSWARVSPGQARWFAGVVEHHRPAVVITSYVWTAPLVDRARSRARFRSVVDMIDLVTSNRCQWQDVDARLGRRPIDPSEIDAGSPGDRRSVGSPSELDVEMAMYDHFDVTIAISAAEAADVRSSTGRTRVLEAPMTPEPSAALASTTTGAALLVLGPNPFNLQGYVWFVREVVPLVRRRCPDFVVRIVGTGADEVLPADVVEMVGRVDDISAEYAAARFAVVPVWSGTGQQIKVVEAMAHGLATVVLEHAARSSPLTDRVDGLIAEDAEGFADAVVELWTDGELRRDLGRRAHATIAALRDPSPITSALEVVLDV